MYHANEQLSYENYSDFIDHYCRSSPIPHKLLPTIELNESPFNPCLTETQEFGDKQRSQFAELSDNVSRMHFGYESIVSDKSDSTANMPSKRHTPRPVQRDLKVPVKDATRACTPATGYQRPQRTLSEQTSVSDDLSISDSLSALYDRRKEAANT
jgi:hypothetical protein